MFIMLLDRGVIGDDNDVRREPHKYHQYSAVTRRGCEHIFLVCWSENGGGSREGESE